MATKMIIMPHVSYTKLVNGADSNKSTTPDASSLLNRNSLLLKQRENNLRSIRQIGMSEEGDDTGNDTVKLKNKLARYNVLLEEALALQTSVRKVDGYTRPLSTPLSGSVSSNNRGPVTVVSSESHPPLTPPQSPKYDIPPVVDVETAPGRRSITDNEEKSVALYEAVNSLPKSYRRSAGNIADFIRQDPALRVTREGKLIYRGVSLGMTDARDVLYELTRKNKTTDSDDIDSTARSLTRIMRESGLRETAIKNPLYKWAAQTYNLNDEMENNTVADGKKGKKRQRKESTTTKRGRRRAENNGEWENY